MGGLALSLFHYKGVDTMIFYGTPDMLVRLNKAQNRRLKFFRFDSEGRYQTDNERLIKVLKTKFKHDPVDKESVINIVKPDEENRTSEIILKHCKKCEFTCENQGDLLAHYRSAHPKKG